MYVEISMATSRQIKFGYELVDKKAAVPQKHKLEDPGWDLALIELLNPADKSNPRKTYSTGLTLQPSPGYYFEIIARESLAKRGYRMDDRQIVTENSAKVVTITLFKFDDDADPLKIPGRWVHAILHHVVSAIPCPMKITKQHRVRNEESEQSVVHLPQTKYAGDSEEE